ncbi:hypothetical protein [uncultured Microscilla sp.]|uniref:hypothetical protein n=1 Tax=uncultured Microscilla sp. TaxID=432653 RepID=UPI00261A363B|nr:hypothetical protein [uncultured Microscilla sp.]
MKYSLSQDYFETPLFQETVQAYFDTVLQVILQDYTTTEAKGRFDLQKDGQLQTLSDQYDMPYATHVLAGLIPALHLYERHLLTKGWVNEPIAKVYLKVFILGFTFHDANKLFGIEPLDKAIKHLEPIVGQFRVHEFFPAFDTYHQDIYFLTLSDENRTSVLANAYTLTLDEDYVKQVLAILCKFADKLASIQELYEIEEFYSQVGKAVQQLEGLAQTSFGDLQLSYIKLQPNPYILLGQQAMQAAKKILEAQGTKVMYALRDGFIYFGEDLSLETHAKIRQAYQQGGDIKPVPLTKVDAQKCNFGFVGSLPFTVAILQEVVAELADKFLLLSPNGQDKITDYDGFIQFTKDLAFALDLPIKWSNENGKLYLFFRDVDELKPPQRMFVTLFCLHKICWLNAKQHKPWQQDFDAWLKADKALEEPIGEDEAHTLQSVAGVVAYLRKQAKTPNALLKTVLAFIKTYEVCTNKSKEALEQYCLELQQEIVQVLGQSTEDAHSDFKTEFFDKYFTYLGDQRLGLLEEYAPQVPEKKQMCIFTGGVAHLDYKEDVAFGLKARGFGNRTITTLNNNRNKVSGLFAEENRLRKTNKYFPKDANTVVYIDFFETHLPIKRDVLAACLKAKGLNHELKKDEAVVFDKSAKFQYNLYNLEFAKLKPGIESTFFFVRKMLRMTHILGLRTYVTGIMSPYSAHKEIFCYENAPRFLQQLGWHKVRLIELEAVLAEIRLVLLLGKNRIEGNLLKIAQSRQAYFTLFYLLSDDDKKKVHSQLLNFIDQHPEKMKGMTVTNKLVEAATAITLGYKSGAEETWLIRTALKYLRLNIKQKYETPAYERKQVIGEISGSIDRALRNEDGRDKRMEAIEVFAAKVYDELFVKEWKRKLPNLNREKDWVYHFAFYYRTASVATITRKKAAKLKKQWLEAGEEMNEANVRRLLKVEKLDKHAKQYLSIILNNEKNN